MKIYILVACDHLEEEQESHLKKALPDLRKALEHYAEDSKAFNVKLINHCDSEFCEDWQLGIAQTVKNSKQLAFPINLFNELAKQFKIDCEIGFIRKEGREAVSYFGSVEGKGDADMIAQYLNL